MVAQSFSLPLKCSMKPFQEKSFFDDASLNLAYGDYESK